MMYPMHSITISRAYLAQRTQSSKICGCKLKRAKRFFLFLEDKSQSNGNAEFLAANSISLSWRASRTLIDAVRKLHMVGFPFRFLGWREIHRSVIELFNRKFKNCNYVLLTKLPWPEDSEGTFRSLSQAATCPTIYHT